MFYKIINDFFPSEFITNFEKLISSSALSRGNPIHHRLLIEFSSGVVAQNDIESAYRKIRIILAEIDRVISQNLPNVLDFINSPQELVSYKLNCIYATLVELGFANLAPGARGSDHFLFTDNLLNDNYGAANLDCIGATVFVMGYAYELIHGNQISEEESSEWSKVHPKFLPGHMIIGYLNKNYDISDAVPGDSDEAYEQFFNVKPRRLNEKEFRANDYALMGAFLEEHREFDTALIYLGRAQSIDPLHLSSYFNSAGCKYEQGDLKNAILFCQKALNIFKGHKPSIQLLDIIAQIFVQNRQYDDALEIYVFLKSFFPDGQKIDQVIGQIEDMKSR